MGKAIQVIGLREAMVGKVPAAPTAAGMAEGCVLLQAGLNKSRRRMYTPEFIQANLSRFEGAFCNADHPSLTEAKDLPERSLMRLAGVVRNARWDDARQAAVGDVEFLGTQAGATMREAFGHEVVRDRAGLSIYWAGPVKMKREKVQEAGGWVDVPLALDGDERFDVDFVTRPAAGGKVGNLRESEEDDMALTDVTLEMLEAERPDLVEAVRKGFAPIPVEKPEAKPVEKADETAPGLLEAERRIADLEVANRKLLARDVVRVKLAEAKLPEKARALVESRFAGAETAEVEVFGRLVEAEIKAVSDLLAEAGVRGVGAEAKPPGDDFDVMAGAREAFGLPAPKTE